MTQNFQVITGKRADGPGIKSKFIVSKKGIVEVQLEAGIPAKGFEWHISAQDGSRDVVDVLKEWIESYCNKVQSTMLLPIDLEGIPPYTKSVLRLLQGLPFGSTITYQKLAILSENPKGARAVGNACGRNPCPLIIPCHRVVASHGGLGGFSCGVDIKKVLLAFEK